jgi:hypothetical protein
MRNTPVLPHDKAFQRRKAMTRFHASLTGFALLALSACTVTTGSGVCGVTPGCEVNNGGCDINATCGCVLGQSSLDDYLTCECNHGFEGNGFSCAPVVLPGGCDVDNGGCDFNALCTEDEDAVWCDCVEGFEGDGFTCTPITFSACATDNGGCDVNALCSEDEEYVYCDCDVGFAGSGWYCEPATFPEAAYDFIDDDTLNELEDLEVPIHYGDNPPDVTGTYFLDSLMDWLYVDITYDNYYVAFSEQNAAGMINVCTYSEDSTDSSCTVAAYITGWGDECFTIFANLAGRVDACEYDATSVYSGCVTEDGDVADYFEAFYDRDQQGQCDDLAAIGELSIIYEDDGVAEWTE